MATLFLVLVISSKTFNFFLTLTSDSALHSNKKGRTLVSKHPYHQAQENRCYEGSSDESAFNGPIAAAEFDRMKKEIETLKAALHESKKTTKRQSKVGNSRHATPCFFLTEFLERNLKIRK